MPVDAELVLAYSIYCRWHNQVVPEELSSWVHDRVWELTRHRPEDAWDLARSTLAVLDDDWAVSYVGVHLLEDLMGDHASRFIDRLEVEVYSSPRMALAVASMWNDAHPVNMRFKALVRSAKGRAVRLRAG